MLSRGRALTHKVFVIALSLSEQVSGELPCVPVGGGEVQVRVGVWMRGSCILGVSVDDFPMWEPRE